MPAVAASGDRLLISLLVKAKEKQSFFGFGGEATVHVWGRPVLDQAQQTLRLTDVELAVESEAAFGLLAPRRARRCRVCSRRWRTRWWSTSNVRQQRAEEDRGRDRRFPEERGRRPGHRRGHLDSPGRHRLRLRTLRVIVDAEGAINAYVSTLPAL